MKTSKSNPVSTLNPSTIPLEPEDMPPPVDFEDYLRRAWAYHSRGKNREAEQDLQEALYIQPDSVDAQYVLGLVRKAEAHDQEAVACFERCVALIDAGKIEDRTRSRMLRRLAQGHINEITTGDWNLEKEIWKRID